jgi:hypothetical protein
VKGGRFFALVIVVVTVVVVIIGVLWPNESVLALSGTQAKSFRDSSTPEAAVRSILQQIGRREWGAAYSSLANQSEFTQAQFVANLTGSHGSLRTYATLDGFTAKTIHATPSQAEVRATLRWASVVGVFRDIRTLTVVKNGDNWEVNWPVEKQPVVPPQVIPVNYLRWDVIYRGPGDEWGSQDVESPHVRIVDMHPVEHAGSVVILGELLNEDVVPAFVTVEATLLDKNGADIATESSFDQMSHVLLPKQVTPFRIDFEGVKMDQIDSVRMQPSASLVSASADPVIEIQSQKLNPMPNASLAGKLVNQSGQVVNIAHVVGTFYDNKGQIIWIASQYVDNALLPQTPVPFAISIPPDLAKEVDNYRVTTSVYSSDRFE